jgi:hypothetical protein
MVTSFCGGRSRSTRREPPTMGKQFQPKCGYQNGVIWWNRISVITFVLTGTKITLYLFQRKKILQYLLMTLINNIEYLFLRENNIIELFLISYHIINIRLNKYMITYALSILSLYIRLTCMFNLKMKEKQPRQLPTNFYFIFLIIFLKINLQFVFQDNHIWRVEKSNKFICIENFKAVFW